MHKLGLLIDASAQVPAHVLANPLVRMLPISIQIDDQMYLDERKEAFTRQFNSQFLNLRAAEVSQSVPPTSEMISEYLVSHIAGEFDHVFGLFVTSTRSPIFKNAFAAASKAIGATMVQRTKLGIKGPLLVECHDSLNMFAGHGAQVLETLRLLESDTPVAQIRANIQSFSKNTYFYVAPSQLDFLVTRARAKGDNSIGAFGKAAAKMLGILPILRGYQGTTEAVAKVRGLPAAQSFVLDITRRELQRGLLAPFVTVSYSGTIDTVLSMPGYHQLCAEAQAKGVAVSLQEMSPTASINLGPNALSVGFIGQEHAPAL
jgi:DegV family protein with EDD domain